MLIDIAELVTPIGAATVAVRAGRVCALRFTELWPPLCTRLTRRFGAVEFRQSTDPGGVVTHLRAYFGGALDALDLIDVDFCGTSFQERVWTALRRIPAGHTMSYGELAGVIGAPSAVRAVGAANGANPIGLVVPCHRVIGSTGTLTGYGGGIERKRWLLEHEGAISRQLSAFSPDLQP